MSAVHPDGGAPLIGDVPKTMQAAHITSYGQPLALAELPCPQVSSLEDGHVLLRVHAVAVQPADIKTRLGKVKAIKGKPTIDNP
jgi:NADPH:quinone reductase-like Zn-dependent oxidoreductase